MVSCCPQRECICCSPGREASKFPCLTLGQKRWNFQRYRLFHSELGDVGDSQMSELPILEACFSFCTDKKGQTTCPSLAVPTCTHWSRQCKTMGLPMVTTEETELGYALRGSKMVWVIIESPGTADFG